MIVGYESEVWDVFWLLMIGRSKVTEGMETRELEESFMWKLRSLKMARRGPKRKSMSKVGAEVPVSVWRWRASCQVQQLGLVEIELERTGKFQVEKKRRGFKMVTESKESSCSVHALRYLKMRGCGMDCLLRALRGMGNGDQGQEGEQHFTQWKEVEEAFREEVRIQGTVRSTQHVF